MKEVISCGLDVHKDNVFCAIYKDGKHLDVLQFSTLTPSVIEMCEYMAANGVTNVAMESTGIYWIPIWNIMESYDWSMILVNPYFVKQIPGRKRDVKDAQWLATLLAKNLLRGSLIPKEHIRTMRTYSRAYVKRQQAITRCIQSVERVLELANIRITSMSSQAQSVSVLKVVKMIIEGNTNPDELCKVVHGRIKNRKGKEVKESLTGYIKPEHVMLLRQFMEEYELLLRQSKELEEQMMAISEEYHAKEFEILKSLPGVNNQAAMQIMAETGADMSAFESSNKITKWAGFCPRNDESAGKIKNKSTTKGNKNLRRIMVQVAWAAIGTKNSHFQAKYQQLVVRKGPKKALIAIARKMLSVIWNMLYYGEKYDSSKQPVMSKETLELKRKYHARELEKLDKFVMAL